MATQPSTPGIRPAEARPSKVAVRPLSPPKDKITLRQRFSRRGEELAEVILINADVEFWGRSGNFERSRPRNGLSRSVSDIQAPIPNARVIVSDRPATRPGS